MVYRFSWIAGTTAIALAFWELSSILRDSTSGTPWPVAILLVAVLGGTVTWALLAFRPSALVVAIGNVIAFILTAGLLLAPRTLWTIFPTTATWDVLRFEIGRAAEIIRYGVEPVRPVPGLVLLLAIVFWLLGFLLVAGLLNDRPFIAVMTPLVVALQFVIVDRSVKSLAHIAIFLGVVAFALLAIRIDERDHGSGRLQRVNATKPPSKRPTTGVTVLVGATITLAIVAVAVAGDAVPTEGYVPWRSPSGYSDEYSGSSSYNPFVDIRNDVISQTNTPLFAAKIDGMPADQVRFRTVTLDVYRNGRWQTNRVQVYPTDDDPWIEDSQVYRGEAVPIAATIRIENLSQPWLPAPPTATFIQAANQDDQKAVRVRRLDGSLFLPGDVSYEGMEYTITAEVAKFSGSSMAALARTEDGTLSPLFRTAEQDGQFIPEPDTSLEPLALDNEDFWTDYPDDIGPGVAALAADLTDGLETNFEKALTLEQYFRSPENFTYNARVPSQYVTTSVEDWLTDEDNPYVRNGYCEQFATSMALMARSLGIPSRVVLGFTPGEPIPGSDDTVVVMDRNAHAWVEIWIDEFGWVSFDPTPRAGYAAQSADDTFADFLNFSPAAYADQIADLSLVDAEGGEAGPSNPALGEQPDPIDRTAVLGGGGTTAETRLLPDWWRQALGIISVVFLVVGLAPMVKAFRRRRRRKRLERGDITAAWEDLTDRLADLGRPVPAALTPLEAAHQVDDAFVPLATTYGASVYGERESSTAVIERATDEHRAARQHLATRYSRLERLVAAYRPTRIIARWRRWRGRRNGG